LSSRRHSIASAARPKSRRVSAKSISRASTLALTEPARTRRHPAPARGQAGQQLQRLVDMLDRVDLEAALGHRFDQVGAQHQVVDIAPRQQHALPARSALRRTGVEEALDLLVDAAHRLHLALLVDRAGDG
jgi:hypothetical protein